MDKKNIKDIFALAPMQEGMLFHYLKDPGSDLYFEQLSLNISGEIDTVFFEQAWNYVIEANEMLRTVFRWEKVKNPVQVILKEYTILPVYYDCREIDKQKTKELVEEIKANDREKKFDLREVPFRVTLCKLETAEYEMIISNHHILYDGWSNGIILTEFFKVYNDLLIGNPSIKPAVKTGYKEFVKWIRDRDLTKEEKYWREYLRGADSHAEVSIKNRGKGSGFPGMGSCGFSFSTERKDRIERFVKTYKITLASLLYGAWGLLLQKYNNSSDIIFGSTISGRSAPVKGIENIVGLFINTLPLRIQSRPGEKIQDLLSRINKSLQMREAYEAASPVKMREYGGIDHEGDLFDSILAIENYPLERSAAAADRTRGTIPSKPINLRKKISSIESKLIREKSKLSLQSYAVVEKTHYDLAVSITIFEEITVTFTYNKHRFTEDAVTGMAEHFRCIVDRIIENPGQKTARIEILSEEEKHRLLFEFNDTGANYPVEKTIHELFEEQAAKTPDSLSVTGNCSALTYRKLNEGAVRLAGILRAKSVTRGAIVGIEVERSFAMIIGILGILKAGGAYLPILPGSPVERVRYMLSDSGAAVLILGNASDKGAEDFTPRGIETIIIEKNIGIRENRKTRPVGDEISYMRPNPDVGARCAVPEGIAYVIYTSGSTGGPKGVIVEHRSVVNILFALQREYPLMETDTFLLKTSYVFDVSAAELFGWFFRGGRLAVLEPGGEKDPEKIINAVEKFCVTHINFVPSMFNLFVEKLNERNVVKLAALKYIFLAGEALLPGLVKRFGKLNTGNTVENIYGPTEGTVYACSYSLAEYEGSGSVPIGRPMSNIELFIFNKDNNVQPIGVPGELCMAGAGLSRGYLNRPELTAEKFIYFASGGPPFCKKPHMRGEAFRALHSQIEYQFCIRDSSSGQEGACAACPKTFDDNKSFPGGQVPACVGKRLAAAGLVPGGKILYKTGDLARRLPDGCIEFLGRMDHQVKIRGYRVELGEIEKLLLNHEKIKEAVVIAKDVQDGEKQLHAYIVPHTAGVGGLSNTPNSKELRQYLSLKLPGYMIPAHYTRLEEIPLTPGGKVNRGVLLSSGTKLSTGHEYVTPASVLEKTIAVVWQELLHLEDVGIHDNFFDSGGNSLTIIRLSSRLGEALKKDIPVVTLFNYPTIAGLARHLNREETDRPVELVGDGKEKKEKYNSRELEIAVIGMAGRFPGAENIEAFWNNLKKGVESISFFTAQELIELGADPDTDKLKEAGGILVPAKGVLQGKEHFDSSFFGYTPMEAEIMDPQVRIFHECCWEALEDAGYDPGTHRGTVGLYAGASANPFWEILPLQRGSGGYPEAEHWGAVQFSDKDFMTTRIAYKLDLKGPCVTVQTACSTSLVAIDMACQGLMSGRCDMALVGGVSVTSHDEPGYLYREGLVMSPDGHCRAFAAEGNGIIGGNGAGVVVLKPLREAEAAGDTIDAVIKGSATNNDGREKVGFTAPGVTGQARVIRAAMQAAGVEPGSISYIEAHGTGTALGDPVEIEALKQAFASDRKQFCALGSVKTNIGHLDAAAGIMGFIKTVLALKHSMIPPSLHFKESNPRIDFENSPFYINTGLKEWESNGSPLRAGVSSFGIGGTNAHVILEEWVPDGLASNTYLSNSLLPNPDVGARRAVPGEQGTQFSTHQLIILSAKSEAALEKMTKNLANHFERNPGINLGDAAYTLQVGRAVFPYKRVAVCSTVTEAMGTLASEEPGTASSSFVKRKKDRHLIFMFPGQGSQYVNMGLDLYRAEPVFREEMDRCFEILKPLMDYDLKEILYPRSPVGARRAVPADFASGSPLFEKSGAKTFDEEQQYRGEPCVPPSSIPNPVEFPSAGGVAVGRGGLEINKTAFTQPLIVAFEYSLAKLLLSWGIRPYAMIGHSIGEYTAACLSGVFSLEAALKLVAIRGRLMQEMPPGDMLAVSTTEKELQPLLSSSPGISLAAVNSPCHCVVSGSREEIAAFSKKLLEKGHEHRRLHTSHAFHSEMMEPILTEFAEKVKETVLNKPSSSYISNRTGSWIAPGDAVDPGYWANHLRETVQFSAGISELLKSAGAVFIEVGPGQALTTFVRHQPVSVKEEKPVIIDLVRHPKTNVPDDRFLLDKIGRLWFAGIDIDWHRFYDTGEYRRISLPTYPFEQRNYPVAGDFFDAGLERTARKSLLAKNKEIADWFYVPVWEESILAPRETPEAAAPQTWLIFADAGGLATGLIEKLVQEGRHVIAVKAGSKFSRKKDVEFTINPGRESDYEKLFAGLAQANKVPGKIVHLWNVTESNKMEIGNYLDSGFYSLLNIARSMGKQGTGEEIHLAVVSDYMQDVLGVEELQPEKAVILGPVKVLPLEYPNIKCCSIDIAPGLSLTTPGSRLVEKHRDLLLAEFAAHLPEKVVAYRGSRRWVQAVKPFPIKKTGSPGAAGPLLRERGVYLITGGLGGIGLTLAQYLAKSVRARLVLIGRSGFPPRDQWQQWLATHNEGDLTGLKIDKLLEMEKNGAEILVISADVAGAEQMREAAALIRERFGSLNGVIHSAGVPDGGLIQGRKRDMSEAVFAAKLKGTLILDAILKNEPLEFLLLCSSLASHLVSPGQVAYTSANAFLDAFASSKARGENSPFTTALNWDTWQEVGMAAAGAKQLTGFDISGVEKVHPFLDQRIEKGAGETIYVIHLQIKDHWVLAEHRILGKATLPGTALIEMARAAYGHYSGSGNIHIHEIYFITPMRVEDSEKKEVHTILKQERDRCKFSICSRLHAGEDSWIEHARGEIGTADQAPVKKHDIREIIKKCNKEEITVTGEMFRARQKDDPLNFEFGPRWKNLRRLYFGARQMLSLLELSEEFAGDTDEYTLHPALLDTAVGYFSRENRSQEASLPFSYKGIRILSRLTRRLYSYHEYEEKRGREDDRFSSHKIILMNEAGEELVSIEEHKRLTVSEEAVSRLSEQVPANVPVVEESNEQKFLQHGLLPAEGVEVFSRIIGSGTRQPRIVISTRDLVSLLEADSSLLRLLPGDLAEPGQGKPQGPLQPRPEMNTVYTAPRSDIEKKITDIWRNFLGIEQVGIHDDFFELGGDSLKIMTIAARIRKILNVEVPLSEFFNKPTAAGIAGYIAAAGKTGGPGIDPVEKKEYYPLSSAQKRLYLLQQLDDQGTGYNLSMAEIMAGEVEKDNLEEIFREMIKRHESLRTSFHLVDEQPVQKVHDARDVELEIEYYDTVNRDQGSEIRERQEPIAEIPSPGFSGAAPRMAVDRGGSGTTYLDVGARRAVPGELIEQFIRCFDLSRAPLLRVGLIETGEASFLAVVDMHHIVSDGMSQAIFVRDFMALYREAKLPGLQIQYKDFSEWQIRQKQAGITRTVEKQQEKFWLSQLAGEMPVLDLPYDYPRPMQYSFVGSSAAFALTAEKTAALKQECLKSGTTMFMLLLGIFNVWMSKLSGREDIVVGTGTAGRRHTAVEDTVGMFVNTLALRNYPSAEKTFAEFLKEVRERTLTAFENQDYPFEDLVEKLVLNRDVSRNPLFDVMFTMPNMEIAEIEIPDLTMKPYKLENRTAKFDLVLTALEVGDELHFTLDYSTKLFKKETIKRFITYFDTIASFVPHNSGQSIAGIEILSQRERERQLYRFNDTGAEYPGDKTIHRLFEEQVEKTPDRAAVCGRVGMAGRLALVTYRELNKKSNLPANLLREKGVTSDSIVGLLMKPAIDMIIGILAVLKAGGAYMPMDPTYPIDRIKGMLKDSSASVLLGRGGSFETLSSGRLEGLNTIDMEKLLPGARRSDREQNPVHVNSPRDTAYVIFTSGSSGTPKGVLIEHGNVVRLLVNGKNPFNFSSSDVWTMFHSYCFDFSVWEMYGALLYGGRLVIVPRAMARDTEQYLKLLKKNTVTVLNQTPPAFYNLADEELKDTGKQLNLRYIIFGGEALNPVKLDRWHRKYPGAKLINMYGITETTVHVTFKEIKAAEIERARVRSRWGTPNDHCKVKQSSHENKISTNDSIEGGAGNIGKPIATLHTYIMDNHRCLLPIGVAGELCVGGKGVARGYLNRPELSADKFIDDPFRTGEKLYRSGDLATLSSDGDMAYAGRIDQQVKIRGYRVELEEIANRIMSFAGAGEAAVVDRLDAGGDKRLVAYVVPDSRYAFPVLQQLRLCKKGIPGTCSLHEWSNGMAIFHLNRSEAGFMYREIFEEKSYIKHGIKLEPGACVFDVGANIGMFSLFINRYYPGARVYAFEPIPPIVEVLSLNASMYGSSIKVFPYGISAVEEDAEFTYYPHASVLSGRFADRVQESKTVKAFISNEQAVEKKDERLSDKQLSELLRDQLTVKQFTCSLKPLSLVIRESGAKSIDLLKIDVEKCELDVLEGIEAGDWAKIKQIVIEVHNIDGRLNRVKEKLADRGYRVVVEQDGNLKNTDLYNVYAVLPRQRQVPGSKETYPPVEPGSRWCGPKGLIGDLRTFLKMHLPDYMVPSAIVLLDKMPLTANGKINRRELPEPGFIENNPDSRAPRNERAVKLAEIWSDILEMKQETIGIHCNFFESGGHSLKAAVLRNRIQKVFNVTIPLYEIFQHPTLQEMAGFIRGASKEIHKPVQMAEKKEYYPLSSAQKRLYVLQQVETDNIAYNLPVIMELEGELGRERLEEAFGRLIHRHESLRTSFEMKGGGPVQEIYRFDDIEFGIECYEAELASSSQGALLKNRPLDPHKTFDEPGELIEKFVRPFDLSRAPLLRVGLMATSEEHHILMIDMHHIIMDGISIGIFIKEFMTVCDGEELPVLKCRYKDYSEWQNSREGNRQIKEQEEYWLQELGGNIRVLDLPIDYPGTSGNNFTGSTLRFRVEWEETRILKELAAGAKTSLFMLLLTLVNVLFWRITGQEDIVIGAPVAGRRHANFQKIIGMFVNTLPVRNFPTGEKTFMSFFQEVNQRAASVFENQDYPFEDLVDLLGIRPDAGRNPIFDLVFTLQDVDIPEIKIPGLKLVHYDYDFNISKFHMTWIAVELEDELHFSVRYRTALFKVETLRRLTTYFKEIVAAVVKNKNIKLEDIVITQHLTDTKAEKPEIEFVF